MTVMGLTIAARVAVAAVLGAVIGGPAFAADTRLPGGPRTDLRYRERVKVHVPKVYVYGGLPVFPCYGGYVYAGPHTDSCAFSGIIPYARAIDPYYYGYYGPRLRPEYEPIGSAWGFRD